jgi:hypothetical protein
VYIYKNIYMYMCARVQQFRAMKLDELATYM